MKEVRIKLTNKEYQPYVKVNGHSTHNRQSLDVELSDRPRISLTVR